MSRASESGEHEPGTYPWCINRFVVGEDPILTAISRVVCDKWAVWPEELVGRERAGDAVNVTETSAYDRIMHTAPSRVGHAVLARRVAWHLAGQLSDRSVAAIADAFGGHTTNIVRPYVRDRRALENNFPAPELLEKRLEELGGNVTTELVHIHSNE